MKRRLFLIPAALLAVTLDCFLIPSLSIGGVRPLFTLGLALAATAVTKVQDGMLIAFFGGLLSDLFFHPYLGLSAAAYLAAVAIVYGFAHRKSVKLPLVPLWAFAAAAAAEAIVFVFSLAIGAQFRAMTLLRVTLPSTVLEALLTLPLAALFDSREKGGSGHS